MVFGVLGFGFGIWGLGFGFEVWGLGFGVWGLGLRVGGWRFGIQGKLLKQPSVFDRTWRSN
jgi:hypothetical protein